MELLEREKARINAASGINPTFTQITTAIAQNHEDKGIVKVELPKQRRKNIQLIYSPRFKY